MTLTVKRIPSSVVKTLEKNKSQISGSHLTNNTGVLNLGGTPLQSSIVYFQDTSRVSAVASQERSYGGSAENSQENSQI